MEQIKMDRKQYNAGICERWKILVMLVKTAGIPLLFGGNFWEESVLFVVKYDRSFLSALLTIRETGLHTLSYPHKLKFFLFEAAEHILPITRHNTDAKIRIGARNYILSKQRQTHRNLASSKNPRTNYGLTIHVKKGIPNGKNMDFQSIISDCTKSFFDLHVT